MVPVELVASAMYALHLALINPAATLWLVLVMRARCARRRWRARPESPLQGTNQNSSSLCQRRLCHLRHGLLCNGTNAIRPQPWVRSTLCDPLAGNHSRQGVLNSASLGRLDKFLGAVGAETTSIESAICRSARKLFVKRSRRWCGKRSRARPVGFINQNVGRPVSWTVRAS